MKKYFSAIILIAAGFTLQAQQEPHYAHYVLNQQLYNPAFVGSRNTASVTALHRSQWIGFDGAPISQVLSFQTPIMKKRAGIGATVTRFQMGFEYDWFTSLAYSYNIKLTDDINLRFGLQGTVEYLGFKFSDPDVVQITQGDPATNDGSFAGKYIANAGAGMYITYKDLLYLGASSPQVYPNEIGFDDLSPKTAEAFPHRYLNAGAVIPLSGQFELMPNFLLKWVDQAPLDADISFSVRYLEKYMAGLNFRAGGNKNGDSVGLLTFLAITQNIGAGLAYEFTLSDIRDHQSGSFELIVRYDLRNEKSNLENPRFFRKNKE